MYFTYTCIYKHTTGGSRAADFIGAVVALVGNAVCCLLSSGGAWMQWCSVESPPKSAKPKPNEREYTIITIITIIVIYVY